MEKGIKNILDELLTNYGLDDYVNNQCINALSKCQEYIDNEQGENYTQDEIAVMRENYMFKIGLLSGINIMFKLNNL